jgi:hypothetical protein
MIRRGRHSSPVIGPSLSRSGRQRYSVVVTLLVVLLGVALISLSPLALGVFHGATAQWERLSFIGQTYGAASGLSRSSRSSALSSPWATKPARPSAPGKRPGGRQSPTC